MLTMMLKQELFGIRSSDVDTVINFLQHENVGGFFLSKI
jgi:nitrogen regulatory protein PII-like uncharacterized protein